MKEAKVGVESKNKGEKDLLIEIVVNKFIIIIMEIKIKMAFFMNLILRKKRNLILMRKSLI